MMDTVASDVSLQCCVVAIIIKAGFRCDLHFEKSKKEKDLEEKKKLKSVDLKHNPLKKGSHV
jgi:hypothetical protein